MKNGDLRRFYGRSKENPKDFVRLDANGKVPSSLLPSYVDDVIEGYYHSSKFYEDAAYTKEITAEKGKIYVDIPTGVTYRWSGTQYVIIGYITHNIQADENQTIDSWTVPTLTIEQVTAAYNYMVNGGCTITDKEGTLHLAVVHADMITGHPSVVVAYYWLGYIDYQITEQDEVSITVHKITYEE